MEEQIETLRKELNQLVEETSSLYSEEVVKLSQKLDKLIYLIYLTKGAV
ncbi:aspartyl-phosphate phosphatase Spo0E family protein [Clostridium sp. A1-XYC3]|uniref:Aspartyl-phosphate phosphatase Spo0E family protein n=1 Tax=Clostridium tanneri TaxID=3037988 RepID=A0ABU4JX29_9CLOT|nr:aspartyl-phosphate phosphatase Spo0E family protein [Clostridium sp. A1-XYC3]MDW8802662.1 aspartyl-phosphate phosphatase Spo0E family protein [Clostridium sp. A1-XYC3]